MVELDRHAIEDIGIPSLVLMETAGRAVADAAQALFQQCRRPVLALAGTGNNGADAVVAARHLHERGVPVSVVIVGTPMKLTKDATTQLAIAERLGVPCVFSEGVGPDLEEALTAAGTLIDGLFGTGLTRPIEGPYRAVIEAVAARDRLGVVAVDLPSGVDADTGQVFGVAVPADVTVTFQFPKIGHVQYPGRELTGTLEVADIGIPPSRLSHVSPRFGIVTTGRLQEAFVSRAPIAHKGTFGHLLVVAGAPDRPGAALLAARAALRTGAGLVTIASDRETIQRLSPALEAAMGLSVGLHRPESEAIIEALSERTALAFGPSLAPDARTAMCLKAVLAESRVPAVLDAGALRALGTDVTWLRDRGAAVVLTPHPGEMAHLTGLDTPAVQRDRVGHATRLAAATGAHVVLKGASTVIAHPDGRAGVVVAGNPGMATGGTGDVLTGIIGALLAQGVAPDVAAEAGALAHALAGDAAAAALGEVGLTAPDLILRLTDVIRANTDGRSVNAPSGPRPQSWARREGDG